MVSNDSIGTGSAMGRSVIVRKDHTDTDLTAGKVVLIVFMSIMNVFMFFGNTLSIVTICSTPKLRQQVSYWFVLNLAIIDLLISVTIVPLNTMWEYYGIWPMNKPSCQFFTFADMSFSAISTYSIVLVSIDKYIYITYAIQYYHRMTKRTAVIMIVTVWIFSLAFTTLWLVSDLGTEDQFKDHFLQLNNGTKTCVYILTDTYIIPSVILSFFAPFIVLCFTSSRIVCIASRHLRTIHTFDKPSPSGTNSCKYSTTRSHRNTILGSVQPNHYQKGDSSGCTLQTDCSKSLTNDLSKGTEECGDETKFDDTNGTTTQDIISPGKSCKQVIAIDKDVKEIDCYIHKIWTKFRHKNSRPKKSCNTQYRITENTKGIPCTQSVVPSGSTEPTTDLPSAQAIIKQNHGTLSVKSLHSKDTLDARRSTISKPLQPYCKLFGTVTIVIICFIVMFAPFNVAIIVDLTCHCVEPWLYEDILSVLYYMHSLVNPYIYIATDRKYKTALRSLCKQNFNIRW